MTLWALLSYFSYQTEFRKLNCPRNSLTAHNLHTHRTAIITYATWYVPYLIIFYVISLDLLTDFDNSCQQVNEYWYITYVILSINNKTLILILKTTTIINLRDEASDQIRPDRLWLLVCPLYSNILAVTLTC